ncbi:hypothetical protein DFQ30_003624 [Apophysomyces sp. BC1015]|nr:hypothetical protein DFQ30_003624 [Apophysomyces sp. BC1015]KAG0182025.1 hypothetical protein DFQ29_006143 [Apophysomyces sp. BC1021]
MLKTLTRGTLCAGRYIGSYHYIHSSTAAAASKVVATRVLLPKSQARLEAQGLNLVQWKQDSAMPRDTLLKEIKGKRAEALMCMLSDKIDGEVLEAAGERDSRHNLLLKKCKGPQLKLVTTMSVGYDHIDLETCRKNNIKIGYTPDVLTDATADLTVLLTLAAARKMKQGIRAAENGEWGVWRPSWLCGSQFAGKTLGVVGLGRIGEAVAHRLKAFGIDRVLYWGRRDKPELNAKLGAEFASFDKLLAESDYIVACCSLTPETKEIFNYAAFEKMKPSAIFTNTARGGVVKQDDLVRALEQNLIAGAGLDVTTPEPLPTDNKLFNLPNCVILPHIGKSEYVDKMALMDGYTLAGSATVEAREVMGDMCVDNVLAALRNSKIPFELKA